MSGAGCGSWSPPCGGRTGCAGWSWRRWPPPRSEHPPTEATLKRLVTFARYGARIDKDIAKALQALRALRDRPDAWIVDARDGTSEPDERATQTRICTNEIEYARPARDRARIRPILSVAYRKG